MYCRSMSNTAEDAKLEWTKFGSLLGFYRPNKFIDDKISSIMNLVKRYF